MSRRHDPDRKSKRASKPEDTEDLPLLEAIADELEQVVIGDQAQATCASATEPGFDAAIAVAVPAMDKAVMAEAVAAAVRRVAEASASLVRNHRVVVVFTGDTIIGTGVKTVVGEVLQQAKARKIVIRRGYGDELLHDGPPPRVQVAKQLVDDTVRVEVATGELEAADLPAAMQQELVALVSGARGQKFAFAFTGAARPDAAMRELLTRTLGDAGAVRAAIGERVLFDRELEARVRIQPRGDDVAIDVIPADAELETQEALSMVVPPAAERLAGKVVNLQFQRAPRPQELAHAIALCQQAGPRRLEVAAGGRVDVVLPRLVEVDSKGDEARVRLAIGGRDRAGVAVAFARECAGLRDSLKGRQLAVEVPDDPVADAALVDELLRNAVALLQPKALLRVVGGEFEPVWPSPFTLGSDGAVRTVRIDTDAGKPAQLLAAIERRMPAALVGFRGAAARLQFIGQAAPSRSLTRTLVSLLETAGVQRLEVDDHGAIDLILPPLLRIGGTAPGEVRVAANAAGRDPAQVEAALQRELTGIAWQDATVTLVDSPLTERLVAVAIARGAAGVLLDGREPVQLHPRLLAQQRTGERIELRAAPGADVTMVARQVARELPSLLAAAGDLAGCTIAVSWPGAGVPATGPAATLLAEVIARGPAKLLLNASHGWASHGWAGHGRAGDGRAGDGRAGEGWAGEGWAGDGWRQVFPEVVLDYVVVLGRKDDGAAPLLMLGIDDGDAPEHQQRVLARLQSLADQMVGRRVLLVGRTTTGERALGDDEPVLAAVRAVVDPVAAATLAYRGHDRRGRPYFQVVHCGGGELAIGTAFADPRGRPN